MSLLPLSEATSTEHVGGKAANLSRALELGFRVPRTMVVERAVLRSFLEANGLEGHVRGYLEASTSGTSAELEARYGDLTATVRRASWPDELLRELVETCADLLSGSPYGLAIRSSALFEDSAKASFAGVFESSLGITDADAAVDRVVACWCSLWTPRALRYLERMEIEPLHDAMAVILQELVPATASGVVYTADPATGDPWRFVMHAARGLSADLMSGSGAGDRWVLEWETGAVLDREIVAQPVLVQPTRNGVERTKLGAAEKRQSAISDDGAAGVADAARRLDEAWDTRLDIEWALTSEGLWIVQVRPQTALPDFFPVELSEEERKITWQRPMFVMALRSDLPPGFLTPLYSDMSESEHWFRHQPEDIVLTGIWRDELDRNGYRYAAATTFETFLDYFDDPSQHEPWLDANEAAYRRRWDRRHDELRDLEDTVASGLRETRSAAELIPIMLDVRDHLWDLGSFGWSGPQALGWMCEGLIDHFLKRIDPDLEREPMVGGGERSYTFEVTYNMQELGRTIQEAAVRRAFAELNLDEIEPYLLAEHPHCEFLAAYEALCWRIGRRPPSWRGRPAFWSQATSGAAERMHTVRCALDGTSRDVEEIRRTAWAERERHERRVRSEIGRKAPELAERFDKILGWTRYWTRALNDRHGLTVGLLQEREIIWQVGRRLLREGLLDAPEDVLILRRDDLEAVAELTNVRTYRDAYERRRREYRRHKRLRSPEVLGKAPEPPAAEWTGEAAAVEPPADDEPFEGTGFAGGEVTGRARIVADLDAGLLDSLSAEDILVLPYAAAFAYADWHSLLMVVRGVVSPGRPAHHLCQVARECGVPVVGEVKGDLGALSEGSALYVDGRSGVVRRLRPENDLTPRQSTDR